MKEVLKDIIERLQDKNLKVVSERSGVSYNTLNNIRNGSNTNPTINVLMTIESYLKGSENV